MSASDYQAFLGTKRRHWYGEGITPGEVNAHLFPWQAAIVRWGAAHLSPFTDEERKHLGNVYHLTKVRLSCRTTVTGDVTIEIVRKKRK